MNLCDYRLPLSENDYVKQYIKVFKKMLTYPNVDVNKINIDRWNALMLATRCENHIAMKLLLHDTKLNQHYSFTPFGTDKSYNVLEIANYYHLTEETKTILKYGSFCGDYVNYDVE